MNKRSVHIIILVLSIILILSVTISYMQENTDIYDKKEVVSDEENIKRSILKAKFIYETKNKFENEIPHFFIP